MGIFDDFQRFVDHCSGKIGILNLSVKGASKQNPVWWQKLVSQNWSDEWKSKSHLKKGRISVLRCQNEVITLRTGYFYVKKEVTRNERSWIWQFIRNDRSHVNYFVQKNLLLSTNSWGPKYEGQISLGILTWDQSQEVEYCMLQKYRNRFSGKWLMNCAKTWVSAVSQKAHYLYRQKNSRSPALA